MDSHFFRLLAAELQPQLMGRRIQKIYSPAPDVQTLDLGKGGADAAGRFLVLRFGNKDPLLFPAEEKPRNPEQPDAHTMWLRKRLLGRRLRTQHCDWPRRQLAWELSGQQRDDGDLLLLCLRHGLSLRESLPHLAEDSKEALESPESPGLRPFGCEPQWPAWDVVRRALQDSNSQDRPEVETLWREHPLLTPALRKTLAASSSEEGEALYTRLQQGQCDAFYVYTTEQNGQVQAEALAWRLPESLRKNREERSFPSAVEAATQAGAVTLFSQLSRDDNAADRTARKKANKRLKRALAKTQQEEQRLRALTDLRRKGQAIQAALWQLDPERKLHFVDAPDYEQAGADGEAPIVRVELDPSLSIAANMERFFRLAAKGDRGLPMAAARRQTLQEELEQLRLGRLPQREALQQTAAGKNPGPTNRRSAGRDKAKGLAVQRFRTSDGFLLLRGRNKTANHKLVSQAASPYDIWFHAQDGPGAHLVLKRDHPRQEPPRQSMLEAATLAGLKGWQAGDDKARVICALVKNVRAIKGADLGRVAVDKVLEAFQVPLDPELEERLRVE